MESNSISIPISKITKQDGNKDSVFTSDILKCIDKLEERYNPEKLPLKQFTGYSEIVSSMLGKGYGNKPKNSLEMSKVTFDPGFKVDKVMKKFTTEEKEKLFSGISMPEVDTAEYGLGNLICTLLMSQAYAHLFHFQTVADYPSHIALEMYYKNIDDLVDNLAETAMATRDITRFGNEVFPKGDAVEYFSRLGNYVIESAKVVSDLPKISASAFQSSIDDVTNEIARLLYRLKKLGPDADKNKESSRQAQPLQYQEQVQVPNENFSFSMKQFAQGGSEGIDPDGGCVQKKPNGKWGVVSFKNKKEGEWWEPDYETEEKAQNALKAYHAGKWFGRTFSIKGEEEPQLTEVRIECTDPIDLKAIADDFAGYPEGTSLRIVMDPNTEGQRVFEIDKEDCLMRNIKVEYQKKADDNHAEGCVFISTNNPTKVRSIFEAIRDLGNPGHCFDILTFRANGYTGKKQWDGDGGSQIKNITI